MESTTIAVDVAKQVLEVAVSVRPGQVREQKRLSRTAFMKFCTDQPPATITYGDLRKTVRSDQGRD